MSDALWSILALSAAIAGMAAFAFANPVHWRQLLGAVPQTGSQRTACMLAGSGLLGLSFLFCTLADPVSMAILVWPMVLGVAGAVVAAFLTLHARKRTG